MKNSAQSQSNPPDADNGERVDHTTQTLEQAIDAVVTIDQNNNVTFVNAAAEKLWGYERDEVIGNNVKMLVPQELQSRHDGFVNANRTTGEDKIVGTSREVELVRKDGRRVWTNLSLSKVRTGDEIHYTAFVKDITKERQAREIISQTLEQAIDAVVTIDQNNNVTFVNAAAVKLWGYERDEIIGNNVKMLVPQELQARHDGFVNANRTTGEDKIVGTSREVELVRKDGRRVWTNLSLSKVQLGDEIHYTAFVKDITKERQAREITTQTLEQAIDAVVTIDQNNNVTFVNAAAVKLWGYERNEIIGNNVKMLVPKELQSRHDGFVNANRTTGEDKIVGTSREVELVRKDGRRVWTNLSLSKVRTGDEIHYTAFVKDITKERQARETITQTLEQAIDAVVTIDQDNNVTFINGAAEKLWGYDRDEVIGNNVKMLVPKELQSRHDGFVNANRTTGEDKIVGTSREVQLVRKDGEKIWCVLSLSKVSVGEKIIYTAFVRDVNEDVKRREHFKILSLVANETDNSVIICDPRGCIEYVNAGFTRLTGYALEEVKGQKPGKVLQGPLTDSATVARIRDKLRRQEPFYEEILNYPKVGEPYWVSLAVNPVFDDSGNVERFVSIQANVTETKAAALTSSAKLDAIGRTHAILEWDVNGTLVETNDVFDRITHRATKSDALHLSKMVVSEELDLLRRGRSISKEINIDANGSGRVRLAAELQPVANFKGDIERITLLGTDVTEQRGAVDKSMALVESMLEKISSFASNIQGIAEQTKLLSLNATIESARAGEAGKGFAVVASEVRDLAGTAARSAGQVSDLVDETRGQLTGLRRQSDVN